MKPNSFIFTLFVLGNAISSSISNTNECNHRWQPTDQLNTKITLAWQITAKTNLTVVEFRTNLVMKGFWYGFGFGFSSSLNEPATGLIYVLRWRENDTQSFWDTYNVTKSNVTLVTQNNMSLITFQRLPSSGLLTVRTTLDLNSVLIEQQCLYFVYMRGRFSDDNPLLPDETIFNRTLCPPCAQYEMTSTSINPSIDDVTIDLTNIQNLTIQLKNESTINNFRPMNEGIITSTPFQLSPVNFRTELNFLWFGRIINQLWTNDYEDLNSTSSLNLRISLQDLFLFLINRNSSFPFVCNRFELYSLRSGSVLFASNITLVSSLSENQTINIIEKLIKNVNKLEGQKLKFDVSAHQIIRSNETLKLGGLFKFYSTQLDYNRIKQAELDAAIHLLFYCIVSIACLIILTATVLCLYGYYKCRRRQLRLITKRQVLKFKQDTNSYAWLGQQPSIGSSSPYLIQSTSI